MKVRDLLEQLEGYSPDVEVRIATQPNYPLEATIRHVRSKIEMAEREGEICEDGSCEDEECLTVRSHPNNDTVYIVEGSQIGYAARALF